MISPTASDIGRRVTVTWRHGDDWDWDYAWLSGFDAERATVELHGVEQSFALRDVSWAANAPLTDKEGA